MPSCDKLDAAQRMVFACAKILERTVTKNARQRLMNGFRLAFSTGAESLSQIGIDF
jgi:hypothetical protein